ncbi:hypothetical protein TEA_001053 [Camellia sinensis var. sinensis]|uniref:Uncharacterized protein n=1 Tax=Camellia sinensis var. sinensis TaxID=542762 RepID=A0A4S4EXW9_CAMSN|nr:hypothetical protein TEA_001053 [Camellia sinensis var. sinensis]
MMIKVESIARLPGSSHLISSHLFSSVVYPKSKVYIIVSCFSSLLLLAVYLKCLIYSHSQPSPALVSFASLSLSTFDAKSNSVVVSSEQPMTTIGGESVKEEVKLVAVKVSNPCPDMPSLKLQADECDHNTNPIVLWQSSFPLSSTSVPVVSFLQPSVVLPAASAEPAGQTASVQQARQTARQTASVQMFTEAISSFVSVPWHAHYVQICGGVYVRYMHDELIHCKVMVKKMGLPDGLDFGTSKGYGDVLLEGCCQTWSKIERRIATLEFDHDRKSMGVIVRVHCEESGEEISEMESVYALKCHISHEVNHLHEGLKHVSAIDELISKSRPAVVVVVSTTGVRSAAEEDR